MTAATPLSVCRYCGGNHYNAGVCPRVVEIEYYPDGQVKRVVLIPVGAGGLNA